MGVSPGPAPAVDGERAEVGIDAVPVVGEALARAGVPLVARLTVTGSGEPGDGAVVTVEARAGAVVLAPAVELRCDLPPGRTTVLTDVGLLADPDVLGSPGLPPTAEITVRVTRGGREVGAATARLRVLGPGEWLASPAPLALELLAAHVRPDDPAVAALVGSATDLLRTRTGDAAREPSRTDAHRIDQTAAAIVEALRRRTVRSAPGPTGWADVPQRVRTPTEVLDMRVASNLDAVVTLAAAFEHAGLRPLLWVADGHAFLGYWRTEGSAATTATTDVACLLPLVQDGAVQLVETAMLAEPARPATFADLHRTPLAAWLSGDLHRLVGVTDVHRARRDGIAPLPPAPDAEPAALRRRRPVPTTRWGFPEELLDLRTDDGLTDTAAVPLTLPAARLPDLAGRIAAGHPVTLVPDDQLGATHRRRGIVSARDLPAHQLADLLAGHGGVYAGLTGTDYARRLDALADRAAAAAEQTGDALLHLALGSLVWELDGRPVRSPLLLVPVALSRVPGSGARRLALDPAGVAAGNDRLLTELHRRTGLELPVPDARADPAGALSAVLSTLPLALARAGLPGRVEPTAHLALLPLPAQQRRADADRHPTEFMRNPLVAALVSGPAGTFRPRPPDPADAVDVDFEPALDDLDDLAARLPLPADTSQLRAVADARAGATFVLDGAPGTGRTHTVVNLVAAAVGAGRRVLVVAGAEATRRALAGRLAAAGLGAVVGDLPGADPADPDPVDAEELREELAAARRVLTAHRDRVHEPNAAGLSLYGAHAGTVGADDGAPVLPVPADFVVTASDRTVAAVRALLADFPARAAGTDPRPGHPWGLVRSDVADPVDVSAAAAELDAALERFPPAGPLARVLAAVRAPADLDVLGVVLTGPVLRVEDLEPALRADWDERVDPLLAEAAEVAGAAHPGLDAAVPEALDRPLVGIAAAAREAAVAGRLSRTKRLLSVRAELEPVLRDGVEIEPADVPALAEELLAVQELVRDLAARAGEVPGLQVPWNWNPLLEPGLLDEQVHRLRRLRAALLADGPFPAALRRYLLTEPGPDPAAGAALAATRAAVEALASAVGAGDADLAGWAGEEGLLARWEATRAGRAVEEPGVPSLTRWLELLRSLRLLEAAQLPSVRAALLSGAVRPPAAVAAFDRGLAVTALAERAAATGLDAAEAETVQRALDRALELSPRLRSRAAGALAARLPSGGAPVPDDAPALFADPAGVPPCVLTTPAAVASLPPLAGSFDLVVVEDAGGLLPVDAVGALGRGRAAVVVGDSRQGRGEDLLSACLRAGVPRHELTWQHRALDEGLAAVAPGPRTFPSPGGAAAVSLVRVAGAVRHSAAGWTNPAEADAAVAEVLRRPGRAVGVVTLSPAQRRLVEERLRATGDERLTRDLAEGTVWVREPAAATGRECDTVLLSLGCAPDGPDRLAGDLGPLTGAGGQHLLTVAVTRARREVVVLASFPPSLLPGGSTSSAGVRRLRALLDVATGAVPAGAAPRHFDAHREDVAAALRAQGLAVRTDVGTSDFRVDLAVGFPGAAPVLAVLLDGPAWAAREGTTDRDVVPAEALAARWPAVERIWLPGWLADREVVLDRLAAAVAASPAPAVPVTAPAGVPPDEPDDEDDPFGDDDDPYGDEDDDGAPVRTTARPVLAPATLPGEQPFRPWTPRPAGDPRLLHQLANPEAARAVRRTLLAGIAAEGPVHRRRLAELTAAAFGVARLSDVRIEAVLALLPDPAAEYRWPAGLDPAVWAGFRRQSSNADRALEHVPPEEVGNAMVALCRARGGLSREELFDETLAVFGHRRHHPVLIPYLEDALSALARSGRVTRAAGLVVAVR